MTEEPSGACKTIVSMIKELNCQYARAERMMSLRSSNPDNLTRTSIVIDQLFSQLIDTMQLSGVADSVSKGKCEFDNRVKEWFSKSNLDTDLCQINRTSSVITKNSFTSSRSSN